MTLEVTGDGSEPREHTEGQKGEHSLYPGCVTVYNVILHACQNFTALCLSKGWINRLYRYLNLIF